MGDLDCDAKPARDWKANDLRAYNISITSQDGTTFFGAQPVPDGLIDLGLLTGPPLNEPPSNASADEKFEYKTARPLVLLKGFAMYPEEEDEKVVVEFAAGLLDAAEYTAPPRLLRKRKTFKLSICEEDTDAIPDICLLYCGQEERVVLILDQHESGVAAGDAKARLISKAIAAYQYNDNLGKGYNLLPSKYQFIPGILMKGAFPTFFKIPITPELAEAVKLGKYPSNRTIVFEHNPRVRGDNESTEAKENRTHFLRSFHAFRQFVY